jgi:hypothetical protein
VAPRAATAVEHANLGRRGGGAPHATARLKSKPPCGGRGREAPSVWRVELAMLAQPFTSR